jgi:hypothetical protein
MPSTIEFPFSDDDALPTIPITLSYADFSISTNALLDTGSMVNLSPFFELHSGCSQQLSKPCAFSTSKYLQSVAPQLLYATFIMCLQ